jgi:hypothetical protein
VYVEERLSKDRHQERLRQAEQHRAGRQVTELRRLERRRRRAERELVRAGQRVEQLRATLRVVS